jgi:hypothetical protein
VVIIKKRHSTTCGLEEISVLVFAAVDSFDVETGQAGYVDEADAERSAGDRRWGTSGSRPRLGIVSGAGAELWRWLLRVLRKRKSEHVVE